MRHFGFLCFSYSLALVLLLQFGSAQLLGGFSEEKDKTSEISDLVDKVKDDIIKNLNCANFEYRGEPLTALKYRQQVVNGINYIVSVKVGTGTTAIIIHVKIYKDFNGSASLTGVHVVADEGLQISSSLDFKGSLGPVLDVPPQVQALVKEVEADISVSMLLTLDSVDFNTNEMRPLKYRADLTRDGTDFYVKMTMPSFDGRRNKYFIVKIFSPAHRNNATKVSLDEIRSSGIQLDSPIEVF